MNYPKKVTMDKSNCECAVIQVKFRLMEKKIIIKNRKITAELAGYKLKHLVCLPTTSIACFVKVSSYWQLERPVDVMCTFAYE